MAYTWSAWDLGYLSRSVLRSFEETNLVNDSSVENITELDEPMRSICSRTSAGTWTRWYGVLLCGLFFDEFLIMVVVVGEHTRHRSARTGASWQRSVPCEPENGSERAPRQTK